LDILEGDSFNLIETTEIVVAAVSEAGKPGAFLVDLFPWMKFIPAWFPVPDGKERPNIGARLEKVLSIYLGTGSRSNWYDVFSPMDNTELSISETERGYSSTFYRSQFHREATG